MNIKLACKHLMRDSSYDNRKVLNSEDLIKTASLMGYTYADLAGICDVSKTMISHWGNINKADKPTYAQLEPMFERCGRGRFQYELEALPPSAIEYNKFHEHISFLIFFMGMLVFFWFIAIKPCLDNWSDCKKLPWYRMGSFEMIELNKSLKQYKDWKLASKLEKSADVETEE